MYGYLAELTASLTPQQRQRCEAVECHIALKREVEQESLYFASLSIVTARAPEGKTG